MKEKPIFNLTRTTAANLSDQQLKEVLFDDRYKIVGSISEFAKAEPARYKAARKLKQLPPTSAEESAVLRNEWAKQGEPRTFSELELYCRGKHSEAQVKTDVNISDLSKNPVAYAERQVARASYGLPGIDLATALARLAEVSRTPEPKPIAEMFTLSEDLAKVVGLQPGEKVNLATFNAATAACVRLADETKQREISAKASAIIETEEEASPQVTTGVDATLKGAE